MLCLFVFLQLVGILVGIIVLIWYWRSRPGLCDSCRYLLRKGGGAAWKYECQQPHNYCKSQFDRCPQYCANYLPREEQADKRAS